ncbi:hypothetical protein CPSG_03590 [Coccidioides posadasii str. Silveira]|uniref:Uncharacterized protein n=2 Tax=Coccidioides posadasii TaxID=199306 RepID=E9D0G2_COCPS|nr:hypothetical protein CPSG_03590 [Coccidioides posadasii str. Silveira]KMM73021.1 hypothetical protein CPAG_09310 [Coccidioides posadasii RMSCC 3488]
MLKQSSEPWHSKNDLLPLNPSRAHPSGHTDACKVCKIGTHPPFIGHCASTAEESIPPADPGISIPATGLSKQCRLNNVGIRDLRYSLALALPLPRAGWLWIKSPWAVATLHCLLKPTSS